MAVRNYKSGVSSIHGVFIKNGILNKILKSKKNLSDKKARINTSTETRIKSGFNFLLQADLSWNVNHEVQEGS